MPRPGTGYPENVRPSGRYLHHEQHVQPLEEDRADGEEVARQQAGDLACRNLRQEGCPGRAERVGSAGRGESDEGSPR